MGNVYFDNYKEYYRGYGLVFRKDGFCTACSDTPELIDELDYPFIGMGWAVDNGRNYTADEIKKRIDEVIAEREKRIGWVKEFAQTQKKPDWTESYLLSSCDPSNRNGQSDRSQHRQAESLVIVNSYGEYRMDWFMGWVKTSKTKYLYRRFLIEKGYIKKDRNDD